MSIDLAAAHLRSNRRVRLAFTEPLAAGAFASTSYYSVKMQGGTDSPVVAAVFAIPGSGSVCELALGKDLEDRATYAILAEGVPSASGSVTMPGSSVTVFVGTPPRSPRSLDSPTGSMMDMIYGRDLVWADGDLLEDPTGDLASVGGTNNVLDALRRRLMSDGLDWDANYGARLRRFVDGPSVTIGEARGLCTQQLLKDDRVVSARTTVSAGDAWNPEDVPIECHVGLVGGFHTDVSFTVRAG